MRAFIMLVSCCTSIVAAAFTTTDSRWDEQLRWRHRFLLATDEQLGSIADVKQIQTTVTNAAATTDPRLGPIRWISGSVVGVRADYWSQGKRCWRTLYILEKQRGHWKIMHKYVFLPQYLEKI